jgi:hypothetical protein
VAVGFIDPLFANRVGGTVFKTVITTLVKEFMRQSPTATNDLVNLITEQQCLDLCMVSSWSPDLAGKFNICLNSSQRRNSADSGDFLAVNSFFALAERISDVSNETAPAIRGIFEYLRS